MSPKLDVDGNPVITLGGKEFSIPLLAARQNRVITPIVIRLIPLFESFATAGAKALSSVGEKQYDDLQEIAYIALTRKHPDLNRNAFLDLPININELVSAFDVICRQTGIFVPAGDGAQVQVKPKGFDIPGEAPAGNQDSQSTGTESLPT